MISTFKFILYDHIPKKFVSWISGLLSLTASTLNMTGQSGCLCFRC